jgi:hypothetical protein
MYFYRIVTDEEKLHAKIQIFLLVLMCRSRKFIVYVAKEDVLLRVLGRNFDKENYNM